MIAGCFAQDGPVIPDFGRGDECIRENGKFCLNWFLDEFGSRYWPRVVEHIQLTLIALAFGFVIAFAAALIAYRYSQLRGAVRQRHGALLHDPQHRVLPDHGPDHRASAG